MCIRDRVELFSIIFCVWPFVGCLVGLVDSHIFIQIVVLHAVRKQMSISVIQTNKTLMSLYVFIAFTVTERSLTLLKSETIGRLPNPG